MSVPYPSSGVPIRLTSPLTENEQVAVVQAQLLKIDSVKYSCGSFGVDGKYGKYTYGAVRAFQDDHGLTVDGIVGPLTWEKLFDSVEQAPSVDTPVSAPTEDTPVIVTVQQPISGGFDFSKIPDNIDDLFNSYIICLATGTWMPLPVIPENLTESLQASYNDITITGRSSGFKSYAFTSNRSINFNLKLHLDLLRQVSEEIYSNEIDLTSITDFMKSLCVPEYTSNQIRPPVCIIKVTDSLKARGVFNSVSVTHSLPIKEVLKGSTYKGQRRYALLDIQVSFTEVPIKALSSSDIANGKLSIY